MIEMWHFLSSPVGDAATNMAVDEVLLKTATQRRRPLLRVYSWRNPAISIGYFQKFPRQLEGAREIVRRPTGGGLVHHGQDTTYTVVFPPGHPLSEMSTADAYCALHKAVAAAMKVESELHAAPAQSPWGAYECFQKPVAGDVVADGKKLAGAAQRRTKWGLLHQGSIAARLTAGQLQSAFRKTLDVEFEPYHLSNAEHTLVESLVREKYSTDAWNHRVR
jgi:lipoate-protein ligase A